MRGDNLDMLTMLDEAKAELGVKLLMLRLESTGTPANRWQFSLADPDAPAGHRVFVVSIDCPPQSRFDIVKNTLKQQLLDHQITSVAC